jgi:antitoxin component YwqK of YwqJK toxin-antitoxin module
MLATKDIHHLSFPIDLHFKDGKWSYYDENGKLTKEEFWEKGELIETITY